MHLTHARAVFLDVHGNSRFSHCLVVKKRGHIEKKEDSEKFFFSTTGMRNIDRNCTKGFLSDPSLPSCLQLGRRFSCKEIALERESYSPCWNSCLDSPMNFS